jgi:hypothetical protein
MLRLIAYGYAVVFIFLAIFIVGARDGAQLSPTLDSPKWALIVAFIFILPLLFPAIRYLAPYIKSIKFSDFEVTFTEIQVTSFSLAVLADQLKTAAEQASAPEYASMMTSYSSLIVDTLKAVQTTKDEILVVDFRDGKTWIPPNLYFLASLACDKTSVRQIAFVETRHVEEAFVGMSSPEELRDQLGAQLPLLKKAADQSNYRQVPLEQAGSSFFTALANLYKTAGQNAPVREMWLTSSRLFNLAGPVLHRDKIERKDSLSQDDLIQILQSTQPYTAVVKDEQLMYLISRGTLALLIARELAAKSEGRGL